MFTGQLLIPHFNRLSNVVSEGLTKNGEADVDNPLARELWLVYWVGQVIIDGWIILLCP